MIVVNYASKEYRAGQQRLEKSLSKFCTYLSPDFQSFMFRDPPPGSPTHQESPYEFKIHAIKDVMKSDNIILWADASMYCVGDIKRIENLIERDGYYIEEAGHYAGDWCNQHARQYFKLQAYENKIPMFSAGLLGLNRDSVIAAEFLKQWEAAAKAGCFRGDWKDHRHDMTCGSIIAHRLGMKLQRGGSHMAYIGPGYSTPEPQVVFYCQGLI